MNVVDIADRSGGDRGALGRAPRPARAGENGDPQETDETDDLVGALLAGSRPAAERLVEQTYRQTYAALVRMCGDPDLAGIGRVNACQQFHERRFPGAILAHDGMHFSAANRKAHPVESRHAAEAF